MAALEVRDGIRELAREVRLEHGVDLAARIGLHTGVVLRGDMGSPDAPAHDMIVGLTPNQAARVETSAPAGEVAISDATAEIVRGYFELESLGHPEMKGVPAGVEVLRVVRATPAADRLQATRGSLTPLVGRTQELAALRAAWDAVAAPRADACAVRTVTVRGEAGIGKSRVVLALADEALDGNHTVFTGRCAPTGSAAHCSRSSGWSPHTWASIPAPTTPRDSRRSSTGVAPPDSILTRRGCSPNCSPSPRARATTVCSSARVPGVPASSTRSSPSWPSARVTAGRW